MFELIGITAGMIAAGSALFLGARKETDKKSKELLGNAGVIIVTFAVILLLIGTL